MPLFISFAGQPIHLFAPQSPVKAFSGGSSKEQECLLANSCWVWDHTDCPIRSHNVDKGQQGFFLTWTSKAFYERDL